MDINDKQHGIFVSVIVIDKNTNNEMTRISKGMN